MFDKQNAEPQLSYFCLYIYNKNYLKNSTGYIFFFLNIILVHYILFNIYFFSLFFILIYFSFLSCIFLNKISLFIKMIKLIILSITTKK